MKLNRQGRVAALAALSTVSIAAGVLSFGTSANAAPAQSVTYSGYTQGAGWSSTVGSGGTIGTPGSNLRLEAAKFNLAGVSVSAHVQNVGWQSWVGSGATAGTTGKNLRMEALKVKAPFGCTAAYRAYVRTLGWQPWVTSGAIAGTTGKSLSMDAFQLSVSCDPVTSFTAAGDFGLGTTGKSVLKAMGSSKPDFTHLLGDLAYVETTAGANSFCTNANAALPGMSNEVLMGNHDVAQASTYISCLPDKLGVTGPKYGWQYVIDQGPVRVIATAAGLDQSGVVKTYNVGTPEYNWVSQQIDAAKAAGDWVVVSMHKPCISVGAHQCTTTSPNYAPRDLTNLLLAKKVDVVIAAHDHNYSRTHQITGSVTSNTSAALTRVDTDGSFVAGKGTVFLVLGNGGYNPRSIISNAFTSSMAKSWSGGYLGYGKFAATDSALSFTEVPVGSSTKTDAFSITR